MKKRDIILISTFVLLSVIFMIPIRAKAGAGEANIYVRGELYGRYDLSKDETITIDNGQGLVNTIEIADQSVFMKDSTCPGQQCVKSGRISMNNESICCAPAGILIVIRSNEEAEYDAITK